MFFVRKGHEDGKGRGRVLTQKMEFLAPLLPAKVRNAEALDRKVSIATRSAAKTLTEYYCSKGPLTLF